MLDTTLILSNTNRFKTHQTRLSDSATSKQPDFRRSHKQNFSCM